MKQLKIEITLTRPMLGSLPANKELMTDFISSKSENQDKLNEEVASVEESIEKGTTVFPRDDKGIFVWDYQFKGFLKESVAVMSDLGETKISKWAYKRVVDSSIFINPRRIYIMDKDGNILKSHHRINERPLRAETMQGARVALARSEEIDEGCKMNITIDYMTGNNSKSPFKEVNEELIEKALNYGALKGLGQWRNARYGSFEWKEIAK